MRILIFSCALFLSGCVSNNTLMSSSNATMNVTRLHQLELGMTQEEVYQIMRYPSREDQFSTNEGCYDVWFYVTKSTVFGQSEEVPRNLTPVVFKEGIVIGMGYEYYNWLVKKTKNPPTPPPPKTQEMENFEFERSLSPPSSTPAAPTPKKSKPLSMNKAPKKSQPAPADKKKEDAEKKNKQDEEDIELLHEEEEQNFNEW